MSIPHYKQRPSNTNNSGFLLINKPPGPTSHDVIDELRRITGIRQIGHAGTLDPFASGLLLVGIGEATKLLRHYVGLDKKYEAVLRLGAVSDTYDRTGSITETPKTKHQTPRKHQIPITKIQKILKSFIGKQKQLPPMYSAKKIGGKKLYELAREGKSVERRPIDIQVYDIKLASKACPEQSRGVNCPSFAKATAGRQMSIVVHVSSGTYIRTLAHDIGQKLGVGAYLEELKRTAIGGFKLENAVSLCHPERSGAESRDPLYLVNSHTRDSSTPPPFAKGGVGRNDTVNETNWQEHLIPVKTVLISGTFDGVHEGHKNYFQQARALGQRLICIVARDKIAEQIKGRRPRYSEKERLKFVKECPEIDRVYLGIAGNERQVYDFTASLKPDIIALGYDQIAYTANLKEEMKKRGLAVKIVRLKPYHPQKYHSSVINGPQLTGKQKTANL